MAPGIDQKDGIRPANGPRTSVGLAFSPPAPEDQMPLATLGTTPRAIVAGLMRALQPNQSEAHRYVFSDQMSFRTLVVHPFWRDRIEPRLRKAPILWLSGVRRSGRTKLATTRTQPIGPFALEARLSPIGGISK